MGEDSGRQAPPTNTAGQVAVYTDSVLTKTVTPQPFQRVLLHLSGVTYLTSNSASAGRAEYRRSGRWVHAPFNAAGSHNSSEPGKWAHSGAHLQEVHQRSIPTTPVTTPPPVEVCGATWITTEEDFHSDSLHRC